MKQSFSKFALVAATTAALSFPLAQGAMAADAQPMQLAANDSVDNAQEAVSDTWITSKVKASLIADKNISGTNIKVETNKGVVSLSGAVPTSAERDLAIGTAKGIKGVKAVSADGLKAAD